MGFIRGGLLVIAGVLLFISLLTFNSLWALSDSLEYENIQGELVPVVAELIEEQINFSGEIEERTSEIEDYCENNSEFVFSEEGYVIDIPCSVVSEGPDAIMNEGISDVVSQVYYKEYNCDFWNCFEAEQPFFLVSEKSYDYWTGKFYLFLLVSLVLFLIIFFLVENKSNAFIIGGSLVILSSLPMAKIESFFGLFMSGFFLSIFSVFFNKASTIFIIMLVIGIILLAFGIILKFFKIGFKISEFIQRRRSGKKIQKKS